VHVCVPRRTSPKHGNVIYDEAVYDAARTASTSLARLREQMGIDALGEVGDPDPYTRRWTRIASGDPTRSSSRPPGDGARAGCAAT
jgi:hypothetical protein